MDKLFEWQSKYLCPGGSPVPKLIQNNHDNQGFMKSKETTIEAFRPFYGSIKGLHTN